MAKALTIKFLENIKPGPARREIPDGVVAGLYLIVQPSGKASWAVRYRVARRSRKLTIGGYPAISLKVARERAGKVLIEIAEGKDPGAAKKAAAGDDDGRIETVIARFIDRYARPNTRKRTARETQRILEKEIVGLWRGRQLSSVSRADVYSMLDGIMDRGVPVQANRTFAAFRKLCRWSVERGILDRSPCEGVRAPAPAQSRDRILSDAELRVLWDAATAASWPFGPIVKLLVLTGQRRSEVAGMKWSEIDFEKRLWTLPRERTKNGREHVVPLSEPAAAILKALPRIEDSDLVFTTDGTKPVSGFARAKKRLDAALPPDMCPWVLHDIRRTVASGLARLGVSLPVIEKLLNHVGGSFAGVTGVYQRHSFADEKRHAAELWAQHIEQICAGNVATELDTVRR